MKTIKFIFIVLSLVITPKLSAQPRKTVEANPINIAVMLMQRTDTVSIVSSCNYYGYTRQFPEDGYTIFTHPNGSIIRYKYVDPNQPFPTIEVTSKVRAKEDEQILQGLRFQKNGNAYEQKSIGYITRCTFGPHGTLIFNRLMKPKE